MNQLPFASTDVCLRCGRAADRQRFRVTAARSVAYDDLLTGNLCEECYRDLRAFLGKSSP